MGIKSSADRYGAVAITIHWVTVLAILGLLISGFQAEDMDDQAAKAGLLMVHASLGIGILVLTILRILWWWLFDRQPVPPQTMPRWQVIAAHAVHGTLYVVIIGMAFSGLAMFILSGAGDIVFGGANAALPDFDDYPPRSAHGIGARIILVLLAVHIGAALYHQFVRRDRLLARMGLGRVKP